MDVDYILEVKSWIERFVIGLNLCPFANKPFQADKISYVLSDTRNMDDFYSLFKKELNDLLNNETSTSLIILTEDSMEFRQYLDVYAECEKLLLDLNLNEEFQLASFHPEYQFANTDIDEQSNYTNRSPYPLIHILRVKELADAIAAYGDTTTIYERNIEVLNKMSIEDLKSYYS